MKITVMAGLATAVALAAATPGFAGEPRSGDGARSASPLSLLSGARAGLGWTSLRFELDAADSSSTYSAGGLEYTLGVAVNLHENRVIAAFEYEGLRVDGDTETANRATAPAGTRTNTLEPESRRISLAIALRKAGPLGGVYHLQGGYQWIRTDLVRRDFESDPPFGGMPSYTSEHYRLGGPALGAGALVPLGRVELAGTPLHLRLEADAVSLRQAEVELTDGSTDDRGGEAWHGRLGLEARRASWSLFAGWRTGGVNVDADAGEPVPGDPLTRGKATIRTDGAVLLVRIGGH